MAGPVSAAVSTAPAATPPRDPKMWQAAQDFEAVMIGQMTKDMFSTRGNMDDRFGGGFAEETWQGVFAEEIGKDIARRGGVGLADSIYAEMIRMQGKKQ